VVLGFELRALSLFARHSLYCFVSCMPPALFALVIFEIGSHFLPRLAWTMILLCMLITTVGMIGAHHHAHPAFFCWDGVSQTFCLGWPQTKILWSQSLVQLGLQAWATGTWLIIVISCYMVLCFSVFYNRFLYKVCLFDNRMDISPVFGLLFGVSFFILSFNFLLVSLDLTWASYRLHIVGPFFFIIYFFQSLSFCLFLVFGVENWIQGLLHAKHTLVAFLLKFVLPLCPLTGFWFCMWKLLISIY
jgi:hypothetical protein